MPITIGTFNVENLLQRFDFYRYGNLVTERTLSILGIANDDEGMLLRKSLHVALTEDTRQMTAQAVRDLGADILCLQEVDNLGVLEDFNKFYVKRAAGIHYGWQRLIEGNDRRGIDVGVLSKNRITVKSHAHHTFDDFSLFNDELRDYGLHEGDHIFRRDCLEVETKADGEELTLFVCHFKSMSGGRDHTMPVREAEAKAVRKIISDKYGGEANARQAKWLICGDLNEYAFSNGHLLANSGIRPLFEDGFVSNPVENLPVKERWTHYYAGDNSKHQLDYILLSPALDVLNPGVQPNIVRNGQPVRVPGIEDVKRYPRIGYDRPKASDHCPVALTINVT
jgi:endonuclease/exonuclease/phosphatase family metal-dependent hydrolase